MRLGGPTHRTYGDAQEWVAELGRLGYTAAYCPVDEKADDATVRAYEAAARRADIVIAEVGAWSNPISRDEKERAEKIALNVSRLALADSIGARCCVNIAGSRSRTSWAGPDADNYSRETFDLIVETVRGIIDAVKPTRTYYTLECMEWAPPDSADSSEALIRAIDRKAFAVHFDPVNLVWSPRRYYETGAIIREFVGRLGPHIRSCHAKDILLTDEFTVHLKEVRPGLGNLDYAAYLTEVVRLDRDVPIMLEHLPDEAEYAAAAAHLRAAAKESGVEFARPGGRAS